jgi:hypothetical protein
LPGYGSVIPSGSAATFSDPFIEGTRMIQEGMILLKSVPFQSRLNCARKL